MPRELLRLDGRETQQNSGNPSLGQRGPVHQPTWSEGLALWGMPLLLEGSPPCTPWRIGGGPGELRAGAFQVTFLFICRRSGKTGALLRSPVRWILRVPDPGYLNSTGSPGILVCVQRQLIPSAHGTASRAAHHQSGLKTVENFRSTQTPRVSLTRAHHAGDWEQDWRL